MPESRSGPLALRGLGSFHVGGVLRQLAGEPLASLAPVPGSPAISVDPNGSYWVGQMYVQYACVADPGERPPLVFLHGGGMTGACWEGTPDGRPGWQTFFLRAGYDTYLCDAVERGRAGWARSPQFFPGEAFHMPQHAVWSNYRIGLPEGFSVHPGQRRGFDGSRFPLEAFDAFCRQLVPRWPANDPLILAGYNALLQRMPRCVLIAHSQGGGFGVRLAMAHPEKLAALVLVEPGGTGGMSAAEFASACTCPLLCVWGDHIAASPFWVAARQSSDELVRALQCSGGDATTLDLPAAGVQGNSHLPMLDINSDAVAHRILQWLSFLM
jgi:pimeloyl-ACP methyl ester carboxylesterase